MLTLSKVAILAGPDLELIPNGFIEIRGNRISDCGEGKGRSRNSRLDCKGLVAIPGFIDAHTHVGDSVAKEAGVGLPIDDVVSPEKGLKHKILAKTPDANVIVAMRESLKDMVRSGITTFADFREDGIHGVELIRKSARGIPIRPIVFGRLAKVPFTQDELANNELRLSNTALVELTEVLSKVDGISSSSINDFTDPAMDQINALATDNRKLKAIHVAESTESVRKSEERTAHSDVERAIIHLHPDFVVHMTNASNADIELVARSSASVVCCPRANAILGVGVPPLTRMVDRGINVALGTDNVMLSQPDMFREMDYTARAVRAAERNVNRPTCKEVLKMATINGAKALKMEKEIGSIEAGKRADIVLIDTSDLNLRNSRDIVSSLVLRARVNNVKVTITEGKVVYDRTS